MKTKNIFRLRKTAILLVSIAGLSASIFISCVEEPLEDPYFYLEGEPTGLSVDMKENTSSYIVRSNRPWQIVAQGEADWTSVFPEEGDDDGIFTMTVQENSSFDDRTMNFAFMVDGKEQPVLFRIDQEANIPYIEIMNPTDGVNFQSSGGELALSIKTNVDWFYDLDDESWLEEIDVNGTELRFQVARNKGDLRSATLTLTANDFSDVQVQMTISQLSGSIVLEEDFSWLNYGSTVPYEWEDCVRYDKWTQEERDRGWETTPNEYTSNEPLLYSMIGFVKLGKTKYGGDLISPPLDIDGTVNLKVSFKSAVYISAGGAVDDRILKVFALGAGETSVSEFTIDNVPNSLAEDEAGVVNDIWDPARGYSFTITGATSATRIKFLGGDYNLEGVGQGKNRIFLDDIKVEIIE